MTERKKEWAGKASRFIRAELKRADLTYAQLAEKLNTHGLEETGGIGQGEVGAGSVLGDVVPGRAESSGDYGAGVGWPVGLASDVILEGSLTDTALLRIPICSTARSVMRIGGGNAGRRFDIAYERIVLPLGLMPLRSDLPPWSTCRFF